MNRWRAEYDDGYYTFYKEGIQLHYSVCGDVIVDALNAAESRVEELEELLSKYKKVSENKRLIEENRERLLAWEKEGKSYYWMAKEIGIPERSRGAVALWFRKNTKGVR